MKRKIWLIPLALLLIASLVACAAPAPAPTPAPAPAPAPTPAPAPAPTPAPDKVYKWRSMTSYTPEMYPLFAEIPDLVAEATGGALQIDIYYFGEHPFSGEDLWAATRDGKTELGDCNTSYVAGIEPALAMPAMAFVAPYGWSEAKDIMDAVMPMFEEIMAEKWNQKPLFSFGFPGQSIIATFPAVDKASLKGKKIRVCNTVVGEAAAVLGCTPVTMAWAEVYTGLQRGIIDGAVGSISGAMGTRWQEPCKYITRWDYISVPTVFLDANLDALNELPDDIQDAFVKCMAEFGEKQYQYNLDFDTRAMARSVDEFGCTIYPPMLDVQAEINELMQPFYQGEAAKDPVYGQSILDAINKVNEEWAAKM